MTLKFPVLNALGLSPNTNEALHLKVEVSQHEQIAVIQHTPVLVYGRSLVAAHFSLETMMAGKMLVCLERSFARGRSGVQVKGRDFYDLCIFVDDQKYFMFQGQELAHIYETAFQTFYISERTLFWYAERRKANRQLQAFIDQETSVELIRGTEADL